MKKAGVISPSSPTKKSRPALSPEAEEDEMISLAVGLAKEQLRNGTASSQVITHYLKLGTTTARLEKQILEKQKELIEAKTSNLQNNSRSAEIAQKALEAFRHYSGHGDSDDEYQDIF